MQYLFLFFWNLYLHMFSMAYTQPAKDNPVDWVNVFIGTGGHGHTYPGATVPFGMVQLSPDTRLEGWDGCSGYHYSDGIIYGFSHTHLSGTGVADYADILLQPTNAAPNGNNGANGKPGYRSKFEKSTEKASPGKYEVYLRSWQVKVDLTATAHCGFHKYRFDEPTFANIIIDLAHRDKALETNFELINDSTIAGKRISQSWADKQEVYFYMVFSKPYTRAIKMANGSQLGDDAAFDTQNKQMAFEFDLELDAAVP